MSAIPPKPVKAVTSGSGAAQGSFRQAHAWLHTWCGLWFSWLLFAVFLTGTLAVFDEPISHWMTPEHHAEEAAHAAAPAAAGADRGQRLAWGMAYMAAHHPRAEMWEIWPSDADGGGPLKVYWFERGRAYAQASLDPATGQVLPDASGAPVRETKGGHHFVDFHYQLHAGTVGPWIVAAAAMAMLVALVSGVITHKRIFKDFFTFRRGKGQRSWLDAHNAVAVLTLPFQLMIAYTGLALSGYTLMPAGKLAAYGTDAAAQQRFMAELEADQPQPTRRPLTVPDLEPYAARGQALMHQPVRAVVVDLPGDAAARVGIYGWNTEGDASPRLSPTTGMAMFSVASGEVLRVRQAGEVEGGRAMLAQSAMGGLHMARFGGWGLKWLYFLCGLAGTAMMATGAILFLAKRRRKHQGEFGAATARVYRLIEGLNLAAIVGLAIACVGYLWANRLLPVVMPHRADWELRVFFLLWAIALVHAFVRPPPRAWLEQLGALAAMCLALPVLNWLTTGDHLPAAIARADWETTGVEIVVVLLGIAAMGSARVLGRRIKP